MYDLPLDELVWHSPDFPPEWFVPLSYNGVNCVDIHSFHAGDRNIHVTVRNPAGTIGTPLQDTLLKLRTIPIP